MGDRGELGLKLCENAFSNEGGGRLPKDPGSCRVEEEARKLGLRWVVHHG